MTRVDQRVRTKIVRIKGPGGRSRTTGQCPGPCLTYQTIHTENLFFFVALPRRAAAFAADCRAPRYVVPHSFLRHGIRDGKTCWSNIYSAQLGKICDQGPRCDTWRKIKISPRLRMHACSASENTWHFPEISPPISNWSLHLFSKFETCQTEQLHNICQNLWAADTQWNVFFMPHQSLDGYRSYRRQMQIQCLVASLAMGSVCSRGQCSSSLSNTWCRLDSWLDSGNYSTNRWVCLRIVYP